MIIAEFISRVFLGLGDPPLTIIDSTIEYRFRPGTYERFGNKIFYNSVSMRSPEVPDRKNEDKIRVLVLGDSVINGGALSDQSDLATEILARELSESVDWVGNVSAGSWGPANLLAFVQKYGWFEADAVVFVLSSHDLTDLPEFRAEMGPDFPTSSPIIALQEGFSRYLPRYVPFLRPWLSPEPTHPLITRKSSEALLEGRDVLTALLQLAKEQVSNVIVLLHPTMIELRGQPEPHRAEMLEIMRFLDVLVLPMEKFLSDSNEVYRDDIHLTAGGQRIYADILICVVHAILEKENELLEVPCERKLSR